jgi:hypothetical protein
MVMVGGIWMNLSRIEVADCDTLDAAPFVNDLRAGATEVRSALADLRCTGDDAKRNRRSEDLQVVVVDLVFQPLLADLVEAVELVEVYAVSVRHQQAMESDGDSPLLADAGGADLAGLAQHNRSLGNEDVLVVVRVDRIRYEHLHRPHRIAVKPIHQAPYRASVLRR